VKWDISKMDTWKTEDFPLGAAIPEAGNSHDYVTGGWRSERPHRTEEVCTQCLLCWIFCPDTAVVVKDEKVVDFDLDHCKGCGICAVECPTNKKFGRKAIEMIPEGCELPGVSSND
jgi:pyruvate ferredoxin oxidoreductase delta subunit